jgi:hypothetical protein
MGFVRVIPVFLGSRFIIRSGWHRYSLAGVNCFTPETHALPELPNSLIFSLMISTAAARAGPSIFRGSISPG